MNFVEVMRQWARFCRIHNHCGECDFYGKGICGEAHLSDIPFEKIERVIMSWAAEHPAPVYPTWGEYLKKLIPHGSGETTLSFAIYAMQQPIPADIAQKLGLKPKEG